MQGVSMANVQGVNISSPAQPNQPIFSNPTTPQNRPVIYASSGTTPVNQSKKDKKAAKATKTATGTPVATTPSPSTPNKPAQTAPVSV